MNLIEQLAEALRTLLGECDTSDGFNPNLEGPEQDASDAAREALAAYDAQRAWTLEDSNAALAEGWGMFDSGFGREIQRIDEPEGDGSTPRFGSDGLAIAYVYWLANEGSALHQKAIALSGSAA